MDASHRLVNGIDVTAVKQQLLLLGHSVPDDLVVGFLNNLQLDADEAPDVSSDQGLSSSPTRAPHGRPAPACEVQSAAGARPAPPVPPADDHAWQAASCSGVEDSDDLSDAFDDMLRGLGATLTDDSRQLDAPGVRPAPQARVEAARPAAVRQQQALQQGPPSYARSTASAAARSSPAKRAGAGRRPPALAARAAAGGRQEAGAQPRPAKRPGFVAGTLAPEEGAALQASKQLALPASAPSAAGARGPSKGADASPRRRLGDQTSPRRPAKDMASAADDERKPLTLDERCRSFLTRLTEQRQAVLEGAAAAPAASSAGSASSGGGGDGALLRRQVGGAAAAAAAAHGAAGAADSSSAGGEADTEDAFCSADSEEGEERGAPAQGAPPQGDGQEEVILIHDLPAAAPPARQPAAARQLPGGPGVRPGSHRASGHDAAADAAPPPRRYGFPDWYTPVGIHIPPAPGAVAVPLDRPAEPPQVELRGDAAPWLAAYSRRGTAGGEEGLQDQAGRLASWPGGASPGGGAAAPHSSIIEDAVAAEAAHGRPGGALPSVRRLSSDSAHADPLFKAPASPTASSPLASHSQSPGAVHGPGAPRGGGVKAAARAAVAAAPAAATGTPRRGSAATDAGVRRPSTAGAVPGGRALSRQPSFLSTLSASTGGGGSTAFARAAGPPPVRKVDRVARYRQLTQTWNKDSFLRSGGGGMAQPRRPQGFSSYYAALHGGGAGPATTAPGRPLGSGRSAE